MRSLGKHLTRTIGFAFVLIAALPSIASDRSILFLGDSLTAGHGLDPEHAYPNLIAKRIEDANLPYKVIPAGLSGETSAGGLRRSKWVMRQPIEILVLALGANDGLRGIDLDDTHRNLQAIIDFAKSKNPEIQVLIAGMRMPPNLGKEYTDQFENLFPNIAKANGAILIPFLLEGVAGDPALNNSDGIHPNEKGQKIVAANVWRHLEGLLEN